MEKDLHFETQAIQSSEPGYPETRPVSAPIYLTTTFIRNENGTYNHDFLYTRHGNPNRAILQNSIAQLEGGSSCFAFSSGMAAINAVFQSLKPDDHVLIPDDIYYNVYLLLSEIYQRWGLRFTMVDMSDLDALQKAVTPKTKLIWTETPSNPQLKITDIAGAAKIAKAAGALLAVDNTWASPVIQQPFRQGADIVMHSTTKYFGGHSDVLGGCIVLKEEGELAKRIGQVQTIGGAVPSPFDCWLLARGIQTLHLRVSAQSAAAAALATFLSAHPAIEQVNYPGLPSHKNHEVAKQQMQNGFGGMLSVLVKGDQTRAIQVSNKLRLFTTATSLGGVESLVEHRKSVEGVHSKSPENLLRISVGLENVNDLMTDWEQALRI